MSKKELGQYFTENRELQEKVYEFIQNKPNNILEPSVGRGDLVNFVKNKHSNTIFDCYEIDDTIDFIIDKSNINIQDFLTVDISKRYDTIIGNPPYVRTTKGNLYVDFIEKCYNLLNNNGELIFIVPSDFLKLTFSTEIINKMMKNGNFTHIYHPEKETLFQEASIDIIIFRYCKNDELEKTTLYNNIKKFINNSNGIITFSEKKLEKCKKIEDLFDVYVGVVSGKDKIFKNNELGNVKILKDENIYENFILINEFPTENKKLNEFLLENKQELYNRKITKINENNWFKFGALRNIKVMKNTEKQDCIYVKNLTRNKKVAFVSKIGYFGGSLLMMKPKESLDLHKTVDYLNSDNFKKNYMYSGRFKIGHKQLCNVFVDI